MKKIIFLAVISAFFLSCQTTTVKGSGIKGKQAKVKVPARTIVDYQGATLGKEIPEWVALLVEGQYSQKVLTTVMPGLDKKKVFVTIGRGDNLDFVRTWSDLVDIETEVASSLERVAGKAVEAGMTGNSQTTGNKSTPSELEKNISMYRQALSTVRFSGLERIASYWIQTQTTKKKEVVDEYFEYYSVWAMDEALFNSQLDAAMKNIEETTTEANELKDIVKSKLRESLGISNDSSFNDELDNQLF